MRIGVIADTHGYLPPAALEALRGVSLILHAGDIGDEGLLQRLETVARVVAVRGNTDHDLRGPHYPRTRRLMVEGVDIFLCHEPHRAAGLVPPPRVIVHGHTHVPRCEEVDGALWFNPGAISHPREGHPSSVGILTLEDGKVAGEIVAL